MEGGRTVMGLMKSDLESMTPSYGASNGAVNFYVNTNYWQYQSNSAPLVQTLIGSQRRSTHQRAGKFFPADAPEHDLDGGGLLGGHDFDELLQPALPFFHEHQRDGQECAEHPGDAVHQFSECLANDLSPT